MSRRIDKMIGWLCGLAALFACSLFIGILFYVIVRGAGTIDVRFLIEPMQAAGAKGGICYHIIGTLILLVTALTVSALLAFGFSIVHCFYLSCHSTARKLLDFLLYTFNGLPSILFGILGLIIFIRYLGWDK